MSGRMKDLEPCGGDGVLGGGYGRAELLTSLGDFLDDPINFSRVQTAMLLAPPEDQDLLAEVVANLREGIDPGEEAVEAVVRYGHIFCGKTFRHKGHVEDDTGFVGDERWE